MKRNKLKITAITLGLLLSVGVSIAQAAMVTVPLDGAYASRDPVFFNKVHYKRANSTVQFNGSISPTVCTWRNYTNPDAWWDVIEGTYKPWSLGLRDSVDWQFTRLEFTSSTGSGTFPGTGRDRVRAFRVTTRGMWDCPSNVYIHGTLTYAKD